MKKLKYSSCLIDIMIGFLGAGVASTVNQPLWIKFLAVISLGCFLVIKDRVNPEEKFESKLNKAEKLKDKRKAIGLLVDALKMKHIAKEDKIFALENIAKLYWEIGEAQKSCYYYNLAINALQSDLKCSTVSEIEKLEITGKLAVYSFEAKNYECAAHYLDEAISIGMYNKKFFLDSNVLMYMVKIYIADHQKDKARKYYDIFLSRKKCKRNKQVEELLDL